MKQAPLPSDETERLQTLYRYQILDTSPDAAFDELADLAAEICDAPIALISLVDESRQWFKARVGLEVEETARSVAFCAHAILQDELFIVPDTFDDERFADNPLVTGPPNIRFYAGAPLFTAEGYGLGTLCVIDKKPREFNSTQEKALRVLRRHVINLMNLRRQNQELRALNVELDSFGSAVSHDLIAPVRRILGFAQILSEDHAVRLGDEGQELLQRIQGAAVNMQGLVESLHSLSRITRSELNVSKVNLSDLSTAILAELHSAAPERKLETHIEPDMFVYADPGLLRVALQNLLANAWKFTVHCETAQIEVGEKKGKGEHLIYVRDNGAGFDMADVRRLFTPFQRLHSGREFQGSGIGLTTVQRIIHRHGGEISAEAGPGKGATFYFSL